MQRLKLKGLRLTRACRISKVTGPSHCRDSIPQPSACRQHRRCDSGWINTATRHSGERWRKPRSNYGTKRVSLRSVPIKIGWLGISNPQARLPIRPCKSFGGESWREKSGKLAHFPSGLFMLFRTYRKSKHNCWTLTSAGLESLKLVEREGDPRNMQLLVEIFRRSGLEPEVGSYVMKDDGKGGEFTPDSERDGVVATIKTLDGERD